MYMVCFLHSTDTGVCSINLHNLPQPRAGQALRSELSLSGCSITSLRWHWAQWWV